MRISDTEKEARIRAGVAKLEEVESAIELEQVLKTMEGYLDNIQDSVDVMRGIIERGEMLRLEKLGLDH